MHIQPLDTGSRPSMAPTFCSTLADMIGWRSSPSDNRESESKTKTNKQWKTGDPSGNQSKEKRKKESEPDLISIVKKIKKTTRELPLALTSSDAYGRGSKCCDTCVLEKEDYKKCMQDIRVIEMLVDGILEKGEADLMDTLDKDDEEDEDEGEENNENSESPSGKEVKLSIQIGIYCAKSVTEHSLQCVLIKLQKTIGDVIVQVSYVKSNDLGRVGRYKQFDIPVGDLRLLKFEYTNLTDKIITLFKKPSEKKKNKPDICVACVKETLLAHCTYLAKMVKSGKNLKLVMRNQDGGGSKSHCCRRSYPHLHAEAQGKPIVLKYSLPSGRKEPTEELADKPTKHLDDDDDDDDDDGDDGAYQDEQEPEFDRQFDPAAYDCNSEEKKNEDPLSSNIKDTNSNHSEQLSRPEKDDTKSIHSDNLGNKGTNVSRSDTVPLQEDNSHSSNKNGNLPPSNGSPNNNGKENVKNPSIKSVTFKSENSPSINSENDSATTMRPSKKSSDISQDETKNLNENSYFNQPEVRTVRSSNVTLLPVQSVYSIDSKRRSTLYDKDSPGSESSFKGEVISNKGETDDIYCGCNFDEVYKQLGIETSNHTSDLENRHKPTTTVSFADGLEKENIDQSSDEEFEPNHEQSQELNISNSRDGKTPFGPKTIQQTTYVTPEAENKRVYFYGDRDKITFECHDDNADPSTSKVVSNPTYDAGTAEHEQRGLKEITHQNKKVEEILRSLGKESLLLVSSPAKCNRRVNTLLVNNNSASELPLSPSLSSLPLDANDLNYIAREVGKHVSLNKIQEVNVPVVEYEWGERNADDENEKTDDTKWKRAFAGSEVPCDHQHMHCRRKSSEMWWKRIKDPAVLPTITEEEAGFDGDVSRPTNGMSLDTVKSIIRKNQISKPIKRSTELRCCIVEFDQNNIIGNQSYGRLRMTKSNKNIFVHKPKRSNNIIFEAEHPYRARNIPEGKRYSYNSYLQKGDSNNKKGTIKLSSPKTINSLSPVLNEMIMLSAIHLSDKMFPDSVTDFQQKSSKGKSLDCEGREDYQVDSPSFSKSPQQHRNTLSGLTNNKADVVATQKSTKNPILENKHSSEPNEIINYATNRGRKYNGPNKYTLNSNRELTISRSTTREHRRCMLKGNDTSENMKTRN